MAHLTRTTFPLLGNDEGYDIDAMMGTRSKLALGTNAVMITGLAFCWLNNGLRGFGFGFGVRFYLLYFRAAV